MSISRQKSALDLLDDIAKRLVTLATSLEVTTTVTESKRAEIIAHLRNKSALLEEIYSRLSATEAFDLGSVDRPVEIKPDFPKTATALLYHRHNIDAPCVACEILRLRSVINTLTHEQYPSALTRLWYSAECGHHWIKEESEDCPVCIAKLVNTTKENKVG